MLVSTSLIETYNGKKNGKENVIFFTFLSLRLLVFTFLYLSAENCYLVFATQQVSPMLSSLL